MLKDAAPRRGARALLLALLALALGAGCSPDDFLLGDEDRDRNLQRARDSERLGDFETAAEYYERALERSAKSPAVHLGYAALCEGQLRRYPDAVYHYQRYLRLLPAGDPKGEDIRRRITNCTERLATSVPLVIRSETIARDLQAVRNEALGLRAQVTNLTLALGQSSNEVLRLNQWAMQLQGQIQTQAVALAQAQAQAAALRNSGVPPGPGSGAGSGAPPPGGTAGSNTVAGWTRVHRVQPGESMDRIARRYGVSLRALQAANPRIEPRRLKAGVELRIPVAGR